MEGLPSARHTWHVNKVIIIFIIIIIIIIIFIIIIISITQDLREAIDQSNCNSSTVQQRNF